MRAGDIDINRALSLYRKSCSMGSATGCFYLAQMYKFGNGVPESKIDYKKYIEKSKELDSEVYRYLQDIIDKSDADDLA